MHNIVYNHRACGVLYNYLKSNAHPQDIWLLPANICPVVCLTFISAQIGFDFVDIDSQQVIDETIALERLSTGKYSGLLFNNSYGRTFQKGRFFQCIKSLPFDIQLIDDHSLCVPSFDNLIDDSIDLQLYSTGYAKYVDLGYGGWGLVASGRKYEEQNLEYDPTEEQILNSKVQECQKYETVLNYQGEKWLNCASIGSMDDYKHAVEKGLTKIAEHKKSINNIYKEKLPQYIQYGEGWNNWRFLISVEDSESVLKVLFGVGLFASHHYSSAAMIFKGEKMQNTEASHSTIINLFNDYHVDEEFALKTCEVINSILNR